MNDKTDRNVGSTRDHVTPRVAIIGGGIAGLSAAHRLVEIAPELKITLLEANGRLGGVLETVRDTDFCLLVTEPTPFGLHDLKLAVDAIADLDVPFGVAINRQGIGDGKTEEFCRERGIDILLNIPQDMEIARLYSEGIPFVERMPELRERMLEMFEKIGRRTKVESDIGVGQ